MRILVVDDEPDIAELLIDVLSAENYVVDTCADGNEALVKLQETPFDLILCDLVMPSLDGAGLSQTLRLRDPDLADRIVFLTGDTINESARQFLDAAKRPVIEKPFVPQEVCAMLRALLQDRNSI